MSTEPAEAWRENLILERYFAPVLDTPTYASPQANRWPPEQRADLERRAGACGDRLHECGGAVSDRGVAEGTVLDAWHWLSGTRAARRCSSHSLITRDRSARLRLLRGIAVLFRNRRHIELLGNRAAWPMAAQRRDVGHEVVAGNQAHALDGNGEAEDAMFMKTHTGNLPGAK